MADAGINALYPQPPARAESLMAGDPSRIIGIANALNQNVLQQQQIRAGQGIEKLYDGAVGPDGTVDNALLMSRAPTLGVKAPEVVTTLQHQQGQRIQNATAQFEQSAKQNQFVLDGLGTLADKPNVTRDDVNTFVATAARNTGIPSPILNAWVRTLPPGGKSLREALVAQRNMAIGATATAARVPGGPDTTGASTSITTGQANYEGAGVGANTPGSTAPVPEHPVTTVPVRPGIATSLPAGSEKSIALSQEHLARAGNFGQEIFPWQQALQKLKDLGPGGTGPGSKGRQEFESFLYSASPAVSQMLGVDPQKVKNYAEAEKYLTNATQQRAASFGAHTDLGLSTALTGSPSVHINDLAAADVTRAAIGLRRMEHVQTLANAEDPVNYASNIAKFAAKQSPAAYMIDVMTPEQVGRLNKTLKGPEREKFNKSLALAIKYGVVTPPGAANAP